MRKRREINKAPKNNWFRRNPIVEHIIAVRSSNIPKNAGDAKRDMITKVLSGREVCVS